MWIRKEVLKAKPLSNEDILHHTGYQCVVRSYEEVNDHSTMTELFSGKDALVLLYETSEDYGHWVCLIKHSKEIEFFDSYGYKPDSELSFIPERYKKMYDQDYPYLTNLLYKSKKKIIYNEHHLQQNDTSVCGYWCVQRILFRNVKLSKFTKPFLELKEMNEYLPDYSVYKMLKG